MKTEPTDSSTPVYAHGSLSPFLRDILRDWMQREMSDISEQHYCAGWMMGLEDDLWEAISSLPHDFKYGMGHVGVDRLEKLKAVSELLGEWTDGDDWFTIDEWRDRSSER